MKKLSVFLIIILCVVMFAGCMTFDMESGNIEHNFKENNGVKSGEIEGEYVKLDGEKSFNISVEKGDTVKFFFEHETVSGKIEAYIDDNGTRIKIGSSEEIFNGNISGYVYSAKKDDKIKVVIVAEEHRGSFEIEYIFTNEIN